MNLETLWTNEPTQQPKKKELTEQQKKHLEELKEWDEKQGRGHTLTGYLLNKLKGLNGKPTTTSEEIKPIKNVLDNIYYSDKVNRTMLLYLKQFYLDTYKYFDFKDKEKTIKDYQYFKDTFVSDLEIIEPKDNLISKLTGKKEQEPISLFDLLVIYYKNFIAREREDHAKGGHSTNEILDNQYKNALENFYNIDLLTKEAIQLIKRVVIDAISKEEYKNSKASILEQYKKLVINLTSNLNLELPQEKKHVWETL